MREDQAMANWPDALGVTVDQSVNRVVFLLDNDAEDRVGRSIADLIHLLKLFGDRGIEFRSLTDGIDTTTAGGRLVFHIMGALAEFERDLIQERTKAGLRAAKKRGKRLGRPPALTDAQIAHAKTAIEAKRETVSGMAEILGVNRSTLQRALSALPAMSQTNQ